MDAKNTKPKGEHGMLNNMVSAFGKMVGYIKKNGIICSTYTLVLFAVLYNLIVSPIDLNNLAIKIAENNTKENIAAHKESMEKRVRVDELMPSILENIKNHYGLDRVIVLEMHDGTETLNGIAFNYLSATYECINEMNDSIDYVADMYQKQHASSYGELLQMLRKKNFIYYYDLKEYQQMGFNRVIKKMYNNGTQSIMMVALKKYNNLYGVLCLSSSKPTMDTEKIESTIKPYIKQIDELLF